jgi:hypothetical protein
MSRGAKGVANISVVPSRIEVSTTYTATDAVQLTGIGLAIAEAILLRSGRPTAASESNDELENVGKEFHLHG